MGIARLSTLLSVRERFHSERIGESVTVYSGAVQERMRQSAAYFLSHGSDSYSANMRAISATGDTVRRQECLLAYSDCFARGGAHILCERPLPSRFGPRTLETRAVIAPSALNKSASATCSCGLSASLVAGMKPFVLRPRMRPPKDFVSPRAAQKSKDIFEQPSYEQFGGSRSRRGGEQVEDGSAHLSALLVSFSFGVQHPLLRRAVRLRRRMPGFGSGTGRNLTGPSRPQPLPRYWCCGA